MKREVAVVSTGNFRRVCPISNRATSLWILMRGSAGQWPAGVPFSAPRGFSPGKWLPVQRVWKNQARLGRFFDTGA